MSVINENSCIEFTPEEIDPFAKVRQKGTARWILAHILSGPNKLVIIFTLFVTIITSAVSSGMMVLIGMAIDEFTKGNASNVLFYAILVLILGIVSPLLNLFNNLAREILAQRIERDTRHEFYTSLLGKSQSFHDQQKIGDIMARTTNDVRMLNFLISPALSLTFQAFTGLVVPIIFIALFYRVDIIGNPVLAFQLLLTPILFTIFFLITLRSYVNQLGPVSGRLRTEFGMMNSILNETLSGIEVVKGSTQESYEIDKYFVNAKGYRDAFVEQGALQAKYIPLLLIAFAITFGLAHGIYLNLQGLFDIGQIIGYVGLLSNLRFPTFISIWVFAVVKLAVAGAERLLEIMNKESEIDENEDGIRKDIEGTIRFENVSFAYPGSSKPVLKNISFEVKPGQTVAIVGTTGSGKTTLTKLITRLYDVTEGSISIDGIDVRDFCMSSLRNQISFIEQDIFLFSRSIKDNISFGKQASMEEIIAVAKEAQAHNFISSFPNGYDSEVGERGVQLSGGERQRVAIARAFLTDPRILILDDSTSAIDSETEDKIQRAIRRILSGRTTFLITHRLSQIRWADLILVLKKGEIVAQGTHEELLQTSEEYRRIFVKRFDLELPQLLRKVA
ncbi:MAG: ABC transporter ATP-binding protein [Candidatus Hermodarchaeota archaeon]